MGGRWNTRPQALGACNDGSSSSRIFLVRKKGHFQAASESGSLLCIQWSRTPKTHAKLSKPWRPLQAGRWPCFVVQLLGSNWKEKMINMAMNGGFQYVQRRLRWGLQPNLAQRVRVTKDASMWHDFWKKTTRTEPCRMYFLHKRVEQPQRKDAQRCLF